MYNASMSNSRLAAAYVAATAAFLLVLLSLQLPWVDRGENSSRIMWNRAEGPSMDGQRETTYYFDPDANYYPTTLALFRTAAGMTAAGAILAGLLGPTIAIPWATAGKTSRLGVLVASVAGCLLIAAGLVWFRAEDNSGFGLGVWLCILAGLLALVAAAKLAPARERPLAPAT